MAHIETPEVECLARIIARALGHNDHHGMFWERYVLPARLIVAEGFVPSRNVAYGPTETVLAGDDWSEGMT